MPAHPASCPRRDSREACVPGGLSWEGSRDQGEGIHGGSTWLSPGGSLESDSPTEASEAKPPKQQSNQENHNPKLPGSSPWPGGECALGVDHHRRPPRLKSAGNLPRSRVDRSNQIRVAAASVLVGVKTTGHDRRRNRNPPESASQNFITSQTRLHSAAIRGRYPLNPCNANDGRAASARMVTRNLKREYAV